ncbi:thioredoxin family protein [Candidatus Shapirobacteria bacterium]|nr:thioredoxin family protein [Candidatus Shapirobacteria bacterium]
MTLKLFTKKNCPKCPAAKALICELKAQKLKLNPPAGGEKLKVENYNVEDIDGMAEAAFYQVMATPTILICDDRGKELRGWRGEVPSRKEILAKVK